MYQFLGSGNLKTGESVDLGFVEAPDLNWAGKLLTFLAHKGADWQYHLARALRETLSGLRVRFYVATVRSELISQVMVSDARGSGIVSHVFTAPAWRQQGAYRQLMAVQMTQCLRDGIRVLTLGTGFESHPYWIYHSFGFHSVAPGSGSMMWRASADAVQEYLLPQGPVHARALAWGDWPALNVPAFIAPAGTEALPRFGCLGVKGQGNLEGPFITFMRRTEQLETGEQRVLESHSGATVGWCLMQPDPCWFGDAWRVDLGIVPGFEQHCQLLTNELRWPDSPLWTAALPREDHDTWIESLGFRRVSLLNNWLRIGDQRRDVWLWARQ
ncbi:MAG: GNAT family N-acetyltransferase [Chloroflexi bacterium]|nr:GNAT family N-acetyltransferase [Chloroflexota bacterium]